TASNVVVAYGPATKPIDRQLLAEEERTEIAAAEETRLHEIEGSGEDRVFGSSLLGEQTVVVDAPITTAALDVEGERSNAENSQNFSFSVRGEQSQLKDSLMNSFADFDGS